MSATTVSRPRSASPRRTATRSAPAVPRRVSGPAGGRVRVQQRPHHGLTAGARALALVRSLPDHSLIDRLVRGRAWIPVLGVLLVGIVAMQVEILKAGTSLGRSLDRTASLQSQNESLQAGVAGLADYQRIERLAAGMGMEMPSASLLTFVASNPHSQTRLGLAGVHAPDPTGFATQLASQLAAAAQATPSSTQSPATSGSASTGGLTSGTGPAASGTSPATGTTSPTSGTTSAGTDSSATGSAGTSAAGATSSTGATGVGSTTGAPTTTGTTSTATPTGGGGAAALPATGQSGNSTGG